MNAKIGLVVVAAVALLAAACGSSSSSAASSASSPTYSQEVALAQCMRSHGVPNFPNPGQPTTPKVSSPINVNSPTFVAATNACQHLLPSGAHMTFHQSSSSSLAPS